MTSARRMAKDFEVAFSRIQESIAHLSSVERLMSQGGEARADRAGKAPIEVLTFEPIDNEHGKGVCGNVKGTSGIYDVRIFTVRPVRGSAYHCSCQDSIHRGRNVGPCKHTIAMARHWNAKLLCDLTRIADGIGPAMPSTSRSMAQQMLWDDQ